MGLDEPSWWYDPETRLSARLLSPFGAIYGRLAARRFATTTPERAACPLICVGNFTVGGTGKTPLSLTLADHVEGLGRQPWFLTRGYRGRIAGPHRVDPERDTAADVGDEALLLARRGPTVVARDRRIGVRAIAALAGADAVVIMDDGMQNPSVLKDLTLAVVDARRGLGNGRIFPAGPLRAPLGFQLGLADAIIINRSQPSVVETRSVADLRRSFPGPMLSGATRPAGDTTWIAKTRVSAYAGIANPRRLQDLLTELGADIVEVKSYPDHHMFSQAEAARLISNADAAGATLVTTTKDLARLSGLGGVLGELRDRSRVVEISFDLEPGDRTRLRALLAGAIGNWPASG